MKPVLRELKYRTVLKYFLLFALTASLFVFFINKVLAQRIGEHLNAEKELALSTYRGIIHSFHAQADILYYNRLNVPQVISLYSNAQSGTDAERAVIRAQLYEMLLPVYRNIELYHLKQLHFHLPNSESFLRFHRPEKFGDSLLGVRETVAYVNETQKPVSGFEEGRIFNGYRFVYPLLDGKKHIGSVEISISMQAIMEMIRQNLNAEVDFIILADTVTSKVFKEEQKNYTPSGLFDRYLHETMLIPLSSSETTALIKKHIRRHGPLEKMLQKGEVFNFCESDGNNVHIITFVPVVNAVSNRTVAYIIYDREHSDIRFIHSQSTYINLTVIALLAILFALLYRTSVHRSDLESERKQLQSLLDLQKNIVIMTDGEHLKFANRFFFETLRYDSLEQFLEKHECISDLFIADERFFHLGKVPAGEVWVETLLTSPATKRIVKIMDAKETPRIYTVAVNLVGTKYYIVTFTDITLTINLQAKLEQRASRDLLTRAYNREFLDDNFHQIGQAAKVQQKLLGVIMADLDHFKKVNDTYGHNRGDEVLKSFISVIRKTIRQEDYIIRWGGEEFIFLMTVDSIQSLETVADDIRSRIEAEPFEEVGHITVSLGLTIYIEGETIKDTVARADKALYHAKALGRNRVIVDDAYVNPDQYQS